MIRRFYISVLILLFLTSTGLFATSVKTMNLAEMVRSADRVFYGRCLSVQDGVEPRTRMAIREYQFQVIEGLKGVATGEIITVRQLNGRSSGIRVPGLPSYEKGQEVLLFLHGESRLGLTSPVGMAQGLFEKRMTGSDEPSFVNSVQNRNLGHQLRSERVVRGSLTQSELSAVESGNPLPLSVMQRMIKKIEIAQQESSGR